MSELEELIERVKVATGPDRELDHRIHGALGIAPGGYGKCANYEDWVETSIRENWNAPRYTSSIDAALALVERCLPGFVIYSFGNGDLDLRYSDIRAFTGWRCGLAPVGFSIKDNPTDILMWPSRHAPTAPLAILVALLTALLAQE